MNRAPTFWLTPHGSEGYGENGWSWFAVRATPPGFAWILGRRGVRAANKPLPSGVERCSSGLTRDSRVKGFSNVAEVFGSLTARGAEALTSGGIRQVSFCDSWPFLPPGGNGLFCSLLSFARLQKGIWNPTTISLPVGRKRRGSSSGNPIAFQLSLSPLLLPRN